MAFTIDESFLPATLTAAPMTDEEFAEFCSEHPDLFFEMTGEGEIVVMAPTFTFTGFRNSEITEQLNAWSKRNGCGMVGDSSTGFVLPNGARRSPDAAWTEKRRIAQLGPQGSKGFLHLCPDFVIELKSDTDRLRVVRAKMREYMENGAQLGWLIDPERQMIEVYRPGQEAELVSGARSIRGEGLVSEFVLELGLVWEPLG